jgi:replicative DNA helicase
MSKEPTPPHNSEAEQGVLAVLLMDNAAYERVGDLLAERHFYHRDHGAIYGTIARLINANKPADVLTVFDAGGHDLPYLTTLVQSYASSANARRYAEIIVERSRERDLLQIAGALRAEAVSGECGSVSERVDKVVTALLKLADQTQAQEPRGMDEVLAPWLDHLNDVASGNARPGMQTGLIDLDRLTSGGIWRGELWVIGARPSMGKSAMSLTIARNMAREYSVLFLTQEDSQRTLVSRMVASAGRVNLADLRNPYGKPNEMWAGVTEGVDALRQLNLRIDDQASLRLLDVRRKIQQVKRKHGLDVVMIDYLQLMVGDAETRNRELGDIANGLKAAAKDFNVGIVLLSQLSRKADERSGPPQMSDLRESGDIEGAADLIGMLYREHMRRPTEENKHYAELHVCKQKNGPTDTLSLHFDGAYQRFAAWDGPKPWRPAATARSGKGLE